LTFIKKDATTSIAGLFSFIQCVAPLCGGKIGIEVMRALQRTAAKPSSPQKRA
jgi:hypothetical protein